jgi:hypothetical protein
MIFMAQQLEESRGITQICAPATARVSLSRDAFQVTGVDTLIEMQTIVQPPFIVKIFKNSSFYSPQVIQQFLSRSRPIKTTSTISVSYILGPI